MTFASDPPASFSVHLGSSTVTPAGICPQIQRLQCGVYVGEVEEMMCVEYVSVI